MSLAESNEIPAPVADDAGPEAPHGAHAVPRRILIGVYAILIVCTVLTYTVSRIDLGQFNIVAALAIAVFKASLVILYFMHLRWDSPFNGIVIITALLFVALFIGLALLDSTSYQPSLKPTPTTLGP
jgi:cytochrome c oxidase subunit IV